MPEGQHRGFPRDSVEFARALTFTDGLFAIAMTLLVVGVEVPDIPDTESVSELASALDDISGNIISFVISFLVIGRYWMAHHQFFAQLTRIDQGLIAINLVYLLFVAFLPFPTALLGNFFENPLAIAIYSVAVAAVSGMEVVMFRYAREHAMLAKPIPDNVFRWGAMMSLSPVVTFLGSIPLAFISSELAVAFWFTAIPFQIVAQRWKPDGADQYLVQ